MRLNPFRRQPFHFVRPYERFAHSGPLRQWRIPEKDHRTAIVAERENFRKI